MSEAKLNIVGGGKDVGDEELRQWLENYIADHPHLTTVVLSRSDHIGYSRPTLDAYLNGTYFLPKVGGGLGVNPKNTSLEEKIRNYREKVDGAVRSGVRLGFSETILWQKFQYLCKLAVEEKLICLGYGSPGVGKSVAIGKYKIGKMTTMPIEILCSPNITAKYFAQKLAMELKLSPHHPIALLEDMICERLSSKRVPRLIIVDQGNYLDIKAIGTICYIWEKTRTPIVLLGTKKLFDLFMKSTETEDIRAQLISRVGWHCVFDELADFEVKSIVRHLLGDRASDAVVKKFFEITRGNHRYLDMLLPRVHSSIKKNEEAIEKGDFTLEEIIDDASTRLMVA